jgi:hypothetical protein
MSQVPDLVLDRRIATHSDGYPAPLGIILF